MGNFCITYRIDRQDRIISLSDEWQSFADENDARQLSADSVVDRSIFDFISDGRCRHLYRLMIERCREEQQTLSFPFRCDSPEKRRYMSMQISPLDNESTQLTSCVEREEEREPVPLLDESIKRSEEYLTICSWCKKVRIDNAVWVEVEEAIEELGLFGVQTLPQLSHGMCLVCFEDTLKELRK